MRRPLALASRLTVPLAAGVAMALFAVYEIVPASAVESRYLALVATAVLLPIAALAETSVFALAGGSTLAVALVWAIPSGPQRGAALMTLLVGLLALVAARELARHGPRLPLAASVALALALQLVARGARLLEPDLAWRPLLGLVGLPVLVGVALSLLADRHGAPRALIAGATVFVLGGGFTLTGGAALLAFALAAVGAERRWPAWLRLAALGLLLMPLSFLQPVAALALAAAAIAFDPAGLPRWAIVLGVAAALAWLAGGWPGEPGALAWLPLLLPVSILGPRPGTASGSAAGWAASLLLCLGIGLAGLDPLTLAAPLVALALLARDEPLAVSLQGSWSQALVAGTALLAAYPWLRPAPGAAALALAGLAVSLVSAALVAGAFLAAALLLLATRRLGLDSRLRPAPLALLAIAGAILVALPRPGAPLLAGEPIVLSVAHPSWTSALPDGPLVALALDSTLTHAAHLARGTAVAEIHLRDANGGDATRRLRSGLDTGEWAARRADVAPELAATLPPAWLSWVPEDGTFFAQRYRAVWGNLAPGGASQLEIRRAATLPAEVEVVLFQVEARR